MGLVTGYLFFLISSLPVTVPDATDNCVHLMTGDTLYVTSFSGERADWYYALPVRWAYDNMIPGGEPMGLGVDTLRYRLFPLSSGVSCISLIPGEEALLPSPGVFYLTADPPSELLADTVAAVEPLHLQYPDCVIQVVSRPSDDYTGYLFEMINAPFLMTPRLTVGGNHQADCRLGCDCAGLAVYGARRMGLDIPYAGPLGIVRYLTSVVPGEFLPDSSIDTVVYISGYGDSVPVGAGGLVPGDIVHFGTQVSVFLEDKGVIGTLDPEDMLIQSWFDGPHVCAIRDCGFYHLPLRVFRWAASE